jgi:hypothetical protein
MKKKKHVFLFRHCVRSTDSFVNLHNATTPTDNDDVRLGDKNNHHHQKEGELWVPNFWSTLSQSEVQLPDWNVPPYWCTENGMQQMHATGVYIYNTLLKGSKRKVKFHFVSDASQRDVDTSYALQQGISHAILDDTDNQDLYSTTTTISSLANSNVHVTEILPNIFKPFQSTTISNNAMCTNHITTEQWRQEVEDRFQNVVPQPTTSIIDILHLLQLTSATLMDDTDSKATVVVDPIKNEPVLTGMINLIKLVAQMIFYSRASGIGSNNNTNTSFLYRITNEQLYTILLPYIYYSRSVLNVGTTEAATRGALFVRTMIDSIHFSYNEKIGSENSNTVEDDDHDDTVTIIVGHDTDIDAVATAMGISWQLRILPQYKSNTPNTAETINTNYNNSISWYMTPPGSAIYICHEIEMGSNNNTEDVDNDSVVTMSYFAPIYDLESNDGSLLSWQLFPLHLNEESNNDNEKTSISSHCSATAGGGMISMNENSTSICWMYLQQHIHSTLLLYNGATECYNSEAAISIINQERGDNSIPNTNNSSVATTTKGTEQQSNTAGVSSFGSGFGCGVGASMLLMVLLWYRFLHRNFKHQRLRSQYTS